MRAWCLYLMGRWCASVMTIRENVRRGAWLGRELRVEKILTLCLDPLRLARHRGAPNAEQVVRGRGVKGGFVVWRPSQ